MLMRQWQASGSLAISSRCCRHSWDWVSNTCASSRKSCRALLSKAELSIMRPRAAARERVMAKPCRSLAKA
ncbi:hypothetical protein D3C73_1426970 [compost metagenome]